LWPPRVQPFLILGRNLNNVGRRPLDNSNTIQMLWALCFTPIVFFCWISETFFWPYLLYYNFWPMYAIKQKCLAYFVWVTTQCLFLCYHVKIQHQYFVRDLKKVLMPDRHLMDNARWKKASHKSSPWPYLL